jgi:hypothetical protein
MSAQSQSWPAAGEACSAELPQLPAHHARNCQICHHPNRRSIQFQFLRWHKPTEIAQEFGLYDRHNVYRHARAAGLYQRRRCTLVPVYERMLENFDFTKVSSHDIMVAAQRLSATSTANNSPKTEPWTDSDPDALPPHHPSSCGGSVHSAAPTKPQKPQEYRTRVCGPPLEVPDSKTRKFPSRTKIDFYQTTKSTTAAS